MILTAKQKDKWIKRFEEKVLKETSTLPYRELIDKLGKFLEDFAEEIHEESYRAGCEANKE
jgi:hypothetical protein